MSKSDLARQYAKDHPRASGREIARASGIDERLARRIKNKITAAAGGPAPASTASAPAPELSFEEKGGEAVASSCSARITTLEALLQATRVDLSIWEVERHIINKWEVAMKQEAPQTGKVSAIVEPLWQIKIWLRRKSPQLVGMRAALGDLLGQLAVARPPVRRVRFKSLSGGNLAEIDQPDLHFGKLCWSQEAGDDYDCNIAESLFKEGIARHVAAAAHYGIARFLLPMGNDYLNVDNAARTTTAGTPQDEDGRWQRTFTRGRELLTWAIDQLLEVAPVDVVQVPGNHDFERGFYLADAIACTYRGNKHVRVDNTPPVRKYYRWGNSLLGLTHGDKELTKNLPLTMAVERPKDWAETIHREFHCGHLHHEREKVFQPILEEMGVIVRHLNSLSAADAWHAGKGYRAQRASRCFIRHPEHGLLADLKFTVPPQKAAA